MVGYRYLSKLIQHYEKDINTIYEKDEVLKLLKKIQNYFST